MIDEITAFLRRQYDAAESDARAAMEFTTGQWTLIASCTIDLNARSNSRDLDMANPELAGVVTASERASAWDGVISTDSDPGVARHIVRNDPAAILRDLAGKRALLDVTASWQHLYVDGDSWFSCAQAVEQHPRESETPEPGSGCVDDSRAGKPCDCGLDARRLAVLKALAAPFKGCDGWLPQFDAIERERAR
jgi:hypothetical protein